VDWVTDVPNFNGRSVPLQYRFLTAMQGSLGIGVNLNRWTTEEFTLAKSMIAYYKSINATVQNGSLYRLALATQGNLSANQYVSPDQSQSVVFAFLHSQQFGRMVPPLLLRGLDENSIYSVSRIDGKPGATKAPLKLSGAYLMNHGIEPELIGDYDSVSFKLDRLQQN
jgi:Alpha-galactosidase